MKLYEIYNETGETYETHLTLESAETHVKWAQKYCRHNEFVALREIEGDSIRDQKISVDGEVIGYQFTSKFSRRGFGTRSFTRSVNNIETTDRGFTGTATVKGKLVRVMHKYMTMWEATELI